MKPAAGLLAVGVGIGLRDFQFVRDPEHTMRRRFSSTPAPSFGAVLLFLLAAAGCADATGEPAIDTLPLVDVREEVRIGAVDDPELAFSTVSGLVIGPEGHMYSLHRQEGLIRRWTPDGAPAGTIGRQGEGPGEFTNPSDMGWRGDSLWVYDGGNYRVSFFDAEGTFLRSLTPSVDIGATPAGQDPAPRPTALLGDGSLHAQTPAFSDAVVRGTLTGITHVRMDPEGAVVDTLVRVPIGRESVLGVLRDDGGGTFTQQPFGDATLTARLHDGNGLLVLERRAAEARDQGSFRLVRIDLEGDTVFDRAYPYTPVPLPRDTVPAEIEARAERLHEFMGEATGTALGQWRSWVEDAIYAPSSFTPVSRVVSGRDDTIWIERNPPPVEGGSEWLVLDELGEPIFRVRLPERFRPAAAGNGALFGILRDELDVEYIVRYRMASE